ncbi:hypothetical protein SAMN05444280_10715 [Tangfeifania diversioriginum]|uniref:Uncharacterized protein n=1 Tax=Tangfeifania diversioriginum TaxID=1168035 RepID=A0A1M6EJC6_9BACT|nr:hypothetical protein SAMN05444280_10715 [Tangfeifania diversioriginum]
MFSVYEHENRDIFSGTKNYFAVVQSFFKNYIRETAPYRPTRNIAMQLTQSATS